MGCCSVHTWKLAPCQPCHSLGLHIHSLCCWGGAGKGAGELGKMLFAGFLQSAASVRSEPQSTELQLATASICLCDQNSSAGNCSCEWQVCLRGCVRSLPPAALPVKSKCNLL